MRVKSLASSALSRLWFGPTSNESDYSEPVAWGQRGNDVIAETLATGGPCMITRLGSAEVGVIAFYLRWRAAHRITPPYPAGLRRKISVNAGFFPPDDDSLDAFARLYLSAVADTDVMAVWFNRGERRVVADYCHQPRLVELSALLSMLYESPWTACLRGKRVLVVHPFAETIASQYAHHRTQLYQDPSVLPEFELQTLVPPQTIAGNAQGHTSWFDALDQTCERIRSAEYDVALIGAGAYGLPLAAFVKSQKRQAVHVGGALQLLFGIKGRRWEDEYADSIAPLFNDCWVRPSEDERPPNCDAVEGGCYW